MTDNEIEKRLTKRKHALELVADLLRDMSPEDRIDFLDELSSGYCRHCGSEYLPCYCQNDD